MDHCTKCGCKIHGFVTGRKYIDNKVHCRECYYEELGKVVELYPIGIHVKCSIKKKEAKLKVSRFEAIIE